MSRSRRWLVLLWLSVAALMVAAAVLLWPRPSGPGEAGERPGETVEAEAWAEASAAPAAADHRHEHEGRWTTQPWRPVVGGFARDFTDPSGGASAWRTRIGRWVSPYLADQYRAVPVTHIPVGVNPTYSVVAQAGTLVDVEIRYQDGLVLGVRVELSPGSGWTVTTVRELVGP